MKGLSSKVYERVGLSSLIILFDIASLASPDEYEAASRCAPSRPG